MITLASLLNISKRQIPRGVHKHPVSIALFTRILKKIDKEASKQKSSRSEYIELHFETLFFAQTD
jgi:hypothetical protein